MSRLELRQQVVLFGPDGPDGVLESGLCDDSLASVVNRSLEGLDVVHRHRAAPGEGEGEKGAEPATANHSAHDYVACGPFKTVPALFVTISSPEALIGRYALRF